MADEINSDLIKLTILRLVKGKKYGEYKWNLLAGIAAGQSSVEIAVGTTFDPSTKYQAIVCFDELKSDGFIVPNVSTFNTNPDDWVVITEKGLRALEQGVIEVSPSLATAANMSDFGVPNFTAFRIESSQFLDQDLVSCMFLDLDNFKTVNDRFNHDVGDEVIRQAIEVAELVVKGKGKVFHRSGDEILVLLPNFDPHEACAVAERIRSTIEKHDFLTNGAGFVTATIGVSTAPSSCKFDELAVSADTIAMQTKTLGKNQVAHSIGSVNAIPEHVSFARELRGMLSELRANANVAALKGNERVDYSSANCNTAALASLPVEMNSVVDAGYGAVRKIELFVRKFENATQRDMIDANNALIEVKVAALKRISKAIDALQSYLNSSKTEDVQR